MFCGLFKVITPFCSGAFCRTTTSLNSVLEKIYGGSGKMMSGEALIRLKWRRDETGPDIKYTWRRRKVSWISAHFVMFVDLKGYEWTWGSKTLSFSSSWHAVWSMIIMNRQNFGGSDGRNSCMIVKSTHCIFKLLLYVIAGIIRKPFHILKNDQPFSTLIMRNVSWAAN